MTGDTPSEYLLRGKWDRSIMDLRVGDSFTVPNASDRNAVLRRSQRLEIRLISMKMANGEYKIWRTENGEPRRRGQPRIWGKKDK